MGALGHWTVVVVRLSVWLPARAECDIYLERLLGIGSSVTLEGMYMKTMKLFGILALLCLALSGCKAEETAIPVATESNSRTIVITCAGDCTLGTDVAFGGITLPVELRNQDGDMGYFFRNVQPYFSTDDLTVVNLEGTLTDRGVRQDKTFAFRGDPSYVEILKQGSVEAVTLANNHSLDYGEVSMTDTKSHLDAVGIHWVEGLHTKVLDVSGIRIGLIGLNGLSSAAANQLPQAITQVEQESAQIIMIQIHWGIEGKYQPSQTQRDLAYRAIDLGADLVIGHHPHVVQGLEEYKGKMIAYSLGNFCFGGNQNPRDKDSMMYRQTFTVKDGEVVDWTNYQVIPCSISSVTGRNNYQPTPAVGGEKKRISEKIQKISTVKVKFLGEIIP